MLTYIIRRLFFLIFVLFGVSVLIFGILMTFSPERRAAAYVTPSAICPTGWTARTSRKSYSSSDSTTRFISSTSGGYGRSPKAIWDGRWWQQDRLARHSGGISRSRWK